MSIELNHTIVHVKDRWAAARDVGEVLGLPEARAYGPFAELKLDNAASLDFMDTEGEIHGQHYAFLVSEEEFDLILGRLRDDGRQWWADPFKRQPQEINHADGGRGLYWQGPDGHWLEIIIPVRTAAAADPRAAAYPSGQPHGYRGTAWMICIIPPHARPPWIVGLG